MARYRRVPRRAAVVAETVTDAGDLSATLTDAPVVDPATLKKDELVNFAAAAGVETEGTKAEILSRLEKKR